MRNRLETSREDLVAVDTLHSKCHVVGFILFDSIPPKRNKVQILNAVMETGGADQSFSTENFKADFSI